MNMKVAKVSLIGVITMLGACGLEPLNEYVPIVESFSVDETNFNADLEECRTIALNVEGEYRKQQEEKMWKKIGAEQRFRLSLLTGLPMENYDFVLETDSQLEDLNQNDYTYDLVKFGPKGVVNRCLSNRGHKLLNDKGR